MVDSSYNNDYYEEEGSKNSIIKKIKISLGAICLTLSFIILLSLLSYFFTGKADQSLIDSGLSFSALESLFESVSNLKLISSNLFVNS